mmetsp:Transcript_25979/g.33110  ORF Transcript_25979/g.33110 Transcript_25979/m.33110 type:complete len:235 (-) Transcript_25979:60-764(-)
MAYNNQIPPTVYTCYDEEGHPFWCDVEDIKLPGFIYYPNFITEEEESEILDLMQSKEWKGGIGRRTQHYGYTYYHTKHDLIELQPEIQPEETEPLDSLQFFLDKISHFFPDGHPPTQCLVNEYVGNRGISSHVDNPNCFGDVVVGLSLCNPVYMTFQEDKPLAENPKECKVFLDRRSLMVMRDEVRFEWKHAITAMKRIYVPETRQCIHRRGEYCRISLTFREIKVSGTKQVKL